ncbi:MAG: thioredoxin [Lachnospirales bacterium]
MSLVIEANDFKSEVLENEGVVLVDFFAEWCGPCKMVAPILDEISKENNSFKICKIDVDKAETIAQEYGVASIPTMIVFKNGEVVNKHVGALPKDKILELVK